MPEHSVRTSTSPGPGSGSVDRARPRTWRGATNSNRRHSRTATSSRSATLSCRRCVWRARIVRHGGARAPRGGPVEACGACRRRSAMFEARAFEHPSGHVYVALVVGDIGDGRDVLDPAALRVPHRRRARLAALRLRRAAAAVAADDRGRGPRRPGLRHGPRGPRHRAGQQAARLRRAGRRRRHRRREPAARAARRRARLRRRPRRCCAPSASARSGC